MPLPLLGPATVTILRSTPFAIHGDPYFELHVQQLDGTDQSIVRVPKHAITGADPRQGERVELTFLMGQVTALKRA